MAIYTRWGTKIEIIGDCGEQKPKYLRIANRLLKVRNIDPEESETPRGTEFYRFEFTLKATEGWPEIEAAEQAVPKLTLTAKELKAAFKDAE